MQKHPFRIMIIGYVQKNQKDLRAHKVSKMDAIGNIK